MLETVLALRVSVWALIQLLNSLIVIIVIIMPIISLLLLKVCRNETAFPLWIMMEILRFGSSSHCCLLSLPSCGGLLLLLARAPVRHKDLLFHWRQDKQMG